MQNVVWHELNIRISIFLDMRYFVKSIMGVTFSSTGQCSSIWNWFKTWGDSNTWLPYRQGSFHPPNTSTCPGGWLFGDRETVYWCWHQWGRFMCVCVCVCVCVCLLCASLYFVHICFVIFLFVVMCILCLHLTSLIGDV